MQTIVVLTFCFEGQTGQCLIRLVQRQDRQVLRVTVMKGEWEKLLTGANTFEVRNGFVGADLAPEPCRQRDLQLAIIRALDDYFAATSLRQTLVT